MIQRRPSLTQYIDRHSPLNSVKHIFNKVQLITNKKYFTIIIIITTMSSNLDKLKTTFLKHGFNNNSLIRRSEFEVFLNNLLTDQIYTPELSSELWEQTSQGRQKVTTEQICLTIVAGQKIVQNKLFELNNDIKYLRKEAKKLQKFNNNMGYSQTMMEIQKKEQQKKSFEDDLVLLTQPFGINILAYMASASKQNRQPQQNQQRETPEPDIFQDFQKPNNKGQSELKWLFYLCLAFALLEIVVIFKKYDFLNLMVVSCLLFMFFMNQLESTYVKFSLGLLIGSEILDVIWLFMNANDFWSAHNNSMNTASQQGYLRLIVSLTFLGVFLKIPLGIFLYHYRKLQEGKQYNIDLGLAQIQLKSNNRNPLAQSLQKDILS